MQPLLSDSNYMLCHVTCLNPTCNAPLLFDPSIYYWHQTPRQQAANTAHCGDWRDKGDDMHATREIGRQQGERVPP
jgi:hypothetical protein